MTAPWIACCQEAMPTPSSSIQDGQPFSMRAIALEGGRVRLEVRGEIDIATSPQLNAGLLRELLAQHDVEVDLTDVEFMDASALAAIIGARRRFERRERSLLVSLRPSTQPHRLLTLTGILPLLALDDRAPARSISGDQVPREPDLRSECLAGHEGGSAGTRSRSDPSVARPPDNPSNTARGR